ncbi:hypothetical protein [Nodosilinea nodulosa]|uniref:hypothetical protein n=1 Tax=Nodosilinea nodulosa TaxID=416001 RepID=UPI0002F7C3D1|nr:hypothetical protein [Nodosilinea nodulosa]
MTQLSEIEKSKIRFHLGYASYSGIPAQDVGQLEEALNEVWSKTIYGYILQQIEICESAWAKTNQTEEPAGEKTLFVGDINRSNLKWDLAKGTRQWNQYYLDKCDDLALTLHVFNYRNQEVRSQRFERWGAVYLQSIPGPADTSIADHVVIGNLLSSSFGW